MRIISGKYRGRKIIALPGKDIRPTTDRVREAIFSMLGNRVVDAHVLDLYSGSGAMALEAISRGATKAVCVDRSKKAASVIRGNLRSLELDNSLFEVVICDAIHYVKRAFRGGRNYEIIFIDPPYGSDLGIKTLEALSEFPLLKGGGDIIYEFGRKKGMKIPPVIETIKEKRYGDTSVLLCTMREEINE